MPRVYDGLGEVAALPPIRVECLKGRAVSVLAFLKHFPSVYTQKVLNLINMMGRSHFNIPKHLWSSVIPVFSRWHFLVSKCHSFSISSPALLKELMLTSYQLSFCYKIKYVMLVAERQACTCTSSGAQPNIWVPERQHWPCAEGSIHSSLLHSTHRFQFSCLPMHQERQKRILGEMTQGKWLL